MRLGWLAGLALVLAWGCGGDNSSPADAVGGAGGESPTGSGGEPVGSGGHGEDSACEAGCVLTLEADCDNGPPSQDACVSDCEDLLAGACGTEYRALQECSAGEPVSCGDGDIPVVVACSSEQATFIDCLNAP